MEPKRTTAFHIVFHLPTRGLDRFEDNSNGSVSSGDGHCVDVSGLDRSLNPQDIFDRTLSLAVWEEMR